MFSCEPCAVSRTHVPVPVCSGGADLAEMSFWKRGGADDPGAHDEPGSQDGSGVGVPQVRHGVRYQPGTFLAEDLDEGSSDHAGRKAGKLLGGFPALRAEL